MTAPSLTYTLTNGQTADATQVMQNFNDLLNGITDGTKDLSINALTLAGTLTANGNIALGNASADTLTVTASLASHFVPSGDATYDLGSSSIGFRKAYFGGNNYRVGINASGSTSGSWNLTLPVSAGTNNYIMTTDGTGVSAWTAITNSAWYATNSAAGTVSTAAQSIAGLKTFYDGIVLDDAAGQSTLNYFKDCTTWTPAIDNSTGGGAGSAANVLAEGRYTRIGSTVFVQGRIQFDNSGGGPLSGGQLEITGLPFTSVTDTSPITYVSAITFHAVEGLNNTTSANPSWLSGGVASNSTRIALLWNYDLGSATTAVTPSHISGTVTMTFFGAYHLA